MIITIVIRMIITIIILYNNNNNSNNKNNNNKIDIYIIYIIYAHIPQTYNQAASLLLSWPVVVPHSTESSLEAGHLSKQHEGSWTAKHGHVSHEIGDETFTLVSVRGAMQRGISNHLWIHMQRRTKRDTL